MPSRAHLLWQFLDELGNRIPAGTIEIREPGTTTKIAQTIYANDDPDTSVYPNPMVADANGIASFYLINAKRVDLHFSKTGYTSYTVPNLDVTHVANRFQFRGAYSATTSYALNDVVTYNGESWVALRASTGVTPVEGADWSLMAAKGGGGTAATTTFTPAGNIAATDVQAALQEVDVEKQALSEKGAANGYAPLGADSKVPAANLPSVGMLAYKFYDPTATEVKSTTSATFVDADATNLVVTFTAPPSGKVLVRRTAHCDLSTGTLYFWNLRSGTTDLAGSEVVITRLSSASAGSTFSAAVVITGLTAGTSYTYKWGYRTDGTATGRIICGGGYGPAAMEVWAA